MAIWHGRATVEDFNERIKGTLIEHVGIEFVEIGEDFMKARMPVDRRTIQPYGILHGGASLTLAETLGSAASRLCTDEHKERCVGMEINANHVRPVSSGYVYGIAKPVHLGKASHIWEIRISDENDKLVCISRITLAILKI